MRSFGTLKECRVNEAIPSALQNNRDDIRSAMCACVDIEEICLSEGLKYWVGQAVKQLIKLKWRKCKLAASIMVGWH